MTVHLWDRQLTWVAVPKVACTAIKHAFFQVENGRAFQDYQANGRHVHIHDVYPSRAFHDLPQDRIANHLRLAVVRDPVRRFLSCYAHRVIYNRELSQAAAGPALAAAGLPANPGLDAFIDLLADYSAAVPSIAHHAAPQVAFLGPDPGYYAHVFPIERIADFSACAAAILGQPLRLDRRQTEGPKIPASALSPDRLAAIHRHYEQDYDLWGRHF